MLTPLRIPFTNVNPAAGEAGLTPYLPLTLAYEGVSTAASGLLDTGAAINVLPYSLGLALDGEWDEQAAVLQLGGNLAGYPARPLILSVTVGEFPSVRLAFAWTKAEKVPVILGQTNFFMEFDVCFYRSQRAFEVQPKR